MQTVIKRLSEFIAAEGLKGVVNIISTPIADEEGCLDEVRVLWAGQIIADERVSFGLGNAVVDGIKNTWVVGWDG